MLNIDRALSNSQIMRSLTGLTPKLFTDLASQFALELARQKKPLNGELTEEQKKANRAFSRRRVIVEHYIGRIKRYNCVSHVYRNRRENLDDTILLVCSGLSNYYQRSRVTA